MHRRRFLQSALLTLAGPSIVPGQEDALRTMYQPALPAVTAGLEYLASQQAGGAFGTGEWRGNVALTGLAALAFLAGGHHPQRSKYGAVVEKAAGYVVSQAQPDGLLYNPRAQPRGGLWMYSHGLGTLFLAEVYGTPLSPELSRKVLQALKKALALLLRTQNLQGGWRYEAEKVRNADLSVTVAQIMALRAARNLGLSVPDAVFTRCQQFILRCQEMPSGGFHYQPDDAQTSFPMTTAGLVGLHCCGTYQGQAVTKARDYVQNYRPDRAPLAAIHPDYYLYGHHYAAQAMYQAPAALWLPWYQAVRDDLLRPDPGTPTGPTPHRRQKDGSWHDPRHGSHLATALALLILQLPLNYLPIFQK